MLNSHGFKALPVVREGRLAGIEARRGLIRMFHRSDDDIRDEIIMTAATEGVVDVVQNLGYDASWTSKGDRNLLTAVAEHHYALLTSLRCEAPEALCAERIRTRPKGNSDAGTGIATAMRAHADPWPESTAIDTGHALPGAVDQALADVYRAVSSPVHLQAPGPSS